MITKELKKKVSSFVEWGSVLISMQLMLSEYVARCIQIAEEDAAEAFKK